MAKVLLIEPDIVLAAAYLEALRHAGHEAQHATTAQTGMDLADDMLPDVVLLELQLVAHSGIEFLYEFRSYTEWQTIPVVILSHVPPGEYRQSAELLREQLGVRDYYYKPQVTLRSLLDMIETVALRP